MRLAFWKSGSVANELLRLDSSWRENSIELIWDMAELGKEHQVWIGAVSTRKALGYSHRHNCEAHCLSNRVRNVVFHKFNGLILTLRLLWMMHNFHPDVIFLFEQSFLYLKLAVFRFLKIEPVICFARETDLTPHTVACFKKYNIRFFIAPSSIFEIRLKKYGLDTSVKVRLPVYPSCFFSGLPREKKFPYFRFQFLFVGRLIEAKGVFDLLEAFAGCVETYPDIGLYLIGDGAASTELQRRIEKKGLAGKVILLGERENHEIGAYLKRCDVLVLPSYTEGFAKVWYEAMLLAKPMITTPLHGICNILQENRSVLFVNPGDVDHLCAAMKQCYADPELLARLASGIKSAGENLRSNGNFYSCAKSICQTIQEE